MFALLVDEARHRVVETGAGDGLVQHQIHLIRAGATHQLVLGVGGRHDDDGRVLLPLESTANGDAGLESVHARHHPVEQDHVETLPLTQQMVQGLLTGLHYP